MFLISLSQVIPIFIYFLLFLFFRITLQLPEHFAIVILLVLIYLLHDKLDSLANHLTEQLLPSKIKNIRQGIDKFEQRIHDLSHYHELIPEFYKLFNLLLINKSWLFYVFEESIFRRVEYDTSKISSNLPEEIEIKILDQQSVIYDLIKARETNQIQMQSNLQIFINEQLTRLLTIYGKNQLVGLLYFEESNLKVIENPYIRHPLFQILPKAGQVLESTALYLDIYQKNLETRNLFEVSNKLLTSLHSEEILDFILDALAEVIPFDAGVIFLFDQETNKLYKKVSKGYKKGLDLTLKLGQGACGWVAETKQVSLINDVIAAKHYYPIRPETRSQLSIPLEHQEELVGVLALESDQKNYFTSHSIELLKLFANQVVLALHNAKQYEISLTKKHLEHELVNAGKVQSVLLPQHPPLLKNFNISFAHIPSKLVSGDLFDLAPIDQDKLGLVIGDVSGKGAGAAIMMSLVLAGFRAYKKSHLAVCEVVARLNNLLEESISDGRYATLFYAILSSMTNTITYTNAGHNPPILFRKNRKIEQLSGGGIVIGYLPNQIYTQKTVTFEEGDILICYTDGITEALNLEEEEFGEQRLKDVIKNNSDLNSYDLKKRIFEEVNKFTQTEFISDDQTLVVVKHQTNVT